MALNSWRLPRHTLSIISGYSYDEEGSGEQEEAFVVITTPPSNLTVAEGAAAAFRCSADYAVRIVIAKNSDVSY